MEIAIVEPADVGQLARSIARAHVEYQDGERTLQAAERKTEGLREEQRRRRLELGRMLIEAKRGVKHGGWLSYLEKLGIEPRTATNWMREAGYVDGEAKSESPANDSDLNPRVAAGIDKRPRKRDEQPDPPPSPPREDDEPAPRRDRQAEEPGLLATWSRDVGKALVGLDKMIMGYAKSWPKRSRIDLARTLRSVAERIESMAGD